MEAQTTQRMADPLPLRGQRILVCGKGGSGKSSLVALLAKSLAARGYGVLALDGDASNPGGLARLLLENPTQPRALIDFFGGREHVECPVDNPSPLTRVDDSTPVLERPLQLEELPSEFRLDEGSITLLRVGKITRALEGCEGPMSKVTRDLRIAGETVMLIDVEAGIEHFGRGVEQGVDAVLVVVDPTFESLDIADRIAELCRQMGVRRMGAVMNRARPRFRDAIATRLKDVGIPLIGVLDWDSALEEAAFEGRSLPLESVAESVDSIVAALEQMSEPHEAEKQTRPGGGSMAHHVTGIFSDTEAAERVVRDLIESRFNREEISIVVTDREGVHEEEVEHDTGVAEGIAGGVAVGGVLGALGATLVATGVVAAPGLTIFAAGPLVAALKGAVAGAAVGLEVGGLAGLGFWKDEAHIHAEALKKGGIVVAVPAEHEHAEHARKAFTEAGADEVRG